MHQTNREVDITLPSLSSIGFTAFVYIVVNLKPPPRLSLLYRGLPTLNLSHATPAARIITSPHPNRHYEISVIPLGQPEETVPEIVVPSHTLDLTPQAPRTPHSPKTADQTQIQGDSPHLVDTVLKILLKRRCQVRSAVLISE